MAATTQRVARSPKALRCTGIRLTLTGPPWMSRQHEAALQHAKARQKDPSWQHDYRAHRPVVEPKISHFTRRPWGARKARCRGRARILAVRFSPWAAS